jgi:hypothetical protein
MGVALTRARADNEFSMSPLTSWPTGMLGICSTRLTMLRKVSPEPLVLLKARHRKSASSCQSVRGCLTPGASLTPYGSSGAPTNAISCLENVVKTRSKDEAGSNVPDADSWRGLRITMPPHCGNRNEFERDGEPI